MSFKYIKGFDKKEQENDLLMKIVLFSPFSLLFIILIIFML
jgi:hypothetical protein